MKLIKVETKGFKSFADKISLEFDGGVVGVVGPNGSGKSNINDAIKWVLGESSAKSLRGDSMEDVIFAGSKTVPAMKTAEVSLTFDNSEKKVSIPHSKFTITRVLERGKGDNKYYINGEPARLKDIKEIAMESGIGKSSLAIISQGTVSDIAGATPEQRRGIFEEAAGISKYKSRKAEALRKLYKTTEALDKIKTVVNELEKQLAPLKRQAEKAKVYLEKKDKLESVEIALIVEDVTFFDEKLKTLNKELEGVVTSKEDLNERINSSSMLIEEKTHSKYKIENEVLELTNKLQDISEKLRDLEIRNSQTSQRRQMIISGQIEASDKGKLDAMKTELEQLRNKIASYNTWEEKSVADISEKQTNIASVKSDITSLQLDIERSRTNLLRIKTRINVLNEYQNKKTNLFQGTKTIVENKQLFSGVYGIASELLDVEQPYRLAIESVLNNALQNIIVDDSKTAVKFVNFLKKNKAGRATFIPLSSISPKWIREEHLMVAKSQNGFIGTAASLVTTKPQFNILNKYLLGNIIVAQNINDANGISNLLEKRYMVISLDGDIIRPGGVISGGEKSRSKNLLGIEEQIEELESTVPLIEGQISENTAKLNNLSISISEDQSLISELNIETAKVREKRSNLQLQFDSLKTQYEAITKKELTFDNKVAESLSAETLESQKSSIQALLKAKRESILNYNNDLSNLTITKTELEKSLREIIESSSEKMTAKNQAEFILKSSRERLAQEYQMTIEAAQQQAQKLSMANDKAREIVSALRDEIKELGHVNLDAIDTYEEVYERHEKLYTSQEELLTAQQTILSAIDEMDKIIISKLAETVDAVNVEMESIFKTMFGGGTAQVKYTDPSNLLETGIDVIAQPPGKTVRNLKLFSGGEKALIAISLLFAILKSKPLPLCILDEVEAALDDANVARFADYLQELKPNTQFIVVTHRVGTMSRVDHLFGATMQNRGVTSIFSVDLAKAKTIMD